MIICSQREGFVSSGALYRAEAGALQWLTTTYSEFMVGQLLGGCFVVNDYDRH